MAHAGIGSRGGVRSRWLGTPFLRLLALVLGVSGCSSTNLADVIAAASTDQATVCARVTSVYGTLTYLRTNIHGGDVACDTLGVKSTTNVSVPMTITPQFSISPNDPFGPGTPPVVRPR